MITILHGDSYVTSRNKLNELISQAKLEYQAEVVRLDLKKRNLEDLTQALESVSLFGGKQLFVLENLLTLPRSKQKDAFIDLTLDNQDKNIILWDKKSVTPAVKKKLPQAKFLEFKAPVVIFKFLDSLKPKNYKITLDLLHQAITKDAPELLFFLLVKRISQLIKALDDPTSLRGAPWQVGNLKSQAKQFNKQSLIKLHDQLLEIDYQIKTGQTPHPLVTHLDLLLLTL